MFRQKSIGFPEISITDDQYGGALTRKRLKLNRNVEFRLPDGLFYAIYFQRNESYLVLS